MMSQIFRITENLLIFVLRISVYVYYILSKYCNDPFNHVHVHSTTYPSKPHEGQYHLVMIAWGKEKK